MTKQWLSISFSTVSVFNNSSTSLQTLLSAHLPQTILSIGPYHCFLFSQVLLTNSLQFFASHFDVLFSAFALPE
jgi:hypothetical protein